MSEPVRVHPREAMSLMRPYEAVSRMKLEPYEVMSLRETSAGVPPAFDLLVHLHRRSHRMQTRRTGKGSWLWLSRSEKSARRTSSDSTPLTLHPLGFVIRDF